MTLNNQFNKRLRRFFGVQRLHGLSFDPTSSAIDNHQQMFKPSICSWEADHVIYMQSVERLAQKVVERCGGNPRGLSSQGPCTLQAALHVARNIALHIWPVKLSIHFPEIELVTLKFVVSTPST